MNKFIEKIHSLVQPRPESVLGIDIGTSAVKMVEIGWQKSKPILNNVAIIELPDNVFEDGYIRDSEALAGVFGKMLAESGSDCREAILSIGGRMVFVREIAFPKMNEKELKVAVQWDIGKYVPYEQDSYYYDYTIISEKDNEKEMKVLLAAVPKENINAIVESLKEVGIQPLAIDIEQLAAFRTLKNAKNSMLINIGNNATQVSIFQNGSPSITRAIPIASSRFTDVIMRVFSLDYREAEMLKCQQAGLLQSDDSYEISEITEQMNLLIRELAREIARTIEYYGAQNKGVVIDNVFLIGGGARLSNLHAKLMQQMDMRVALHNPLADIAIAAYFDNEYIRAIAPQIAVAVGLALRGGEL